MTAGFLVTDADNTLWDTNRVFADAQLLVLDRIEALTEKIRPRRDRLAYVRRFDQNLARTHPDGLRYPPARLVAALVEDVGATQPSTAELNDILSEYFMTLARKPRLRPGVQATLEHLHENDVTIIVASEGQKDHILSNLDNYGLTALVSAIIAAKKTPELFKHLARRYRGTDPKICVGDQLDRDISPAKAAGFSTYYFPGGFQPSWELDISASDADHIIRNYAELRDAFPIENAA